MVEKLKKIPEIRIKHGWLMQKAFVSYLNEIPKYKDNVAPSPEEMENIVLNRRKLWHVQEDDIIAGMQEITGLDFYANLIDVYLVYGYRTGFSDPLVLSIRYENEHFIDTLTHELIHRILTDNTLRINGSLWVRKNFPQIEDRVATNHILVHAVHKAIYLDILKSPERLQIDIDRCQKSPGYKQAWDMVEKEGYENIISNFKKDNVIKK